MDGQALAFAADSFDVAVSLFGVMLFPDHRAGLREMARVTRPGGRIVVGSWTGLTAPMRLIADAWAEALRARDAVRMPAGVDALGQPDRVEATLAEAGLVLETIEQVTHPWTTPPRDRIAAEPTLLAALTPHWAALNAREQAALTDATQRIARADAGAPFESTACIALARQRRG